MAFTIWSDQIASAIYGGFANSSYRQTFTNTFKDVLTNVKTLATKLVAKSQQVITKIKKGAKFFVDWWKDDPVGATAGAIAVGASLGLVVVVAGSATGAIAGGIAALRSLRIMSLISAGLKLAFVSSAVGVLIRFMVRGVQSLWNFNWNVTDAKLKEQQEGLLINLYSAAGNVVGTTLATLICGTAPIEISKRTNLVKVNPMTLAKIRELTQFNPHSDDYGEVYEEMMDSLKNLIKVTARTTGQIMFLESYKNIRKWIKQGFSKSGLSAVFPGLGKAIAAWGEEGSQSWSFASAFENWVESIPDKKIAAFTEEAVESFMDTCTETSMIISYAF